MASDMDPRRWDEVQGVFHELIALEPADRSSRLAAIGATEWLLPAARAMHLADCSLCRVEAERERKVILELVQLPHFAPSVGFADRVMAKVRVATPSGDWMA